MPYLAIIADDLTGANDTGVQFAKIGLRTQVIIAADGGSRLGDADVIVFATDSRGVAPAIAYNRVAEIARLVKNGSVPVVFKKIDSTLRGNLGAEIDAVLDVLGLDCAIVAPAFPRIGRITVGGYHLLNQTPIQLTEIARDPISPVTESRVSVLLKRQSKYQVSHIELADVLSGQESICRRIAECCNLGTRLICFDATESTHLDQIAHAVRRSDKRFLWVGSAGLAEALPAAYSLPVKEPRSKPSSRGLPVLVVSGSVSNVTANQVSAFLSQPNSALVELNAVSAIENETEEVARCVGLARNLLRKGLNTALVSPNRREAVSAACACGKKIGLQPAVVSERIARSLGLVTRDLLTEDIEGVFLTGGDTAVHVSHALGAAGMEVYNEVSTGIPFATISSGPYKGLKVVTKAGAFGDEQAINRAVAMIQNK